MGERRFERAFATYGAIGWLHDLSRWGEGVARVLTPGGKLVLLEFHPMAWCVDARGRWIDRYLNDEPIQEPDGVGDYVGKSEGALAPVGAVGAVDVAPFSNPEPAVAFQWSVSEIVNALVEAGLRIDELREYPHSNGARLHEGMIQVEGRRFVMPPEVPGMPLMLGVVASRP